jgi:sialic acid synthase SpsE
MKAKVVCEIGSSWRVDDWDDSFNLAIRAIRQAAEAGCDGVKFQCFRADTLYSPVRAPDTYEKIKRYELPLSWLPELSSEAKKLGLEFWVTPFSPEIARHVAPYCNVIKVASGDLTYKPLIHAVAQACEVEHKALALSTGAATLDEVGCALDWIDCHCVGGLILMQCVSAYPALSTEYRLSTPMLDWESYTWGLSDHTTGDDFLVAQLAAAMGYTVFEKHMMADGSDERNPEACVALTPKEMVRYVKAIHDAELISEHVSTKEPHPREMSERVGARRGVDGLRPAK